MIGMVVVEALSQRLVGFWSDGWLECHKLG